MTSALPLTPDESITPPAVSVGGLRKSPKLREPRLPRAVGIAGTGSYVPERILTNADLELIVETSERWILDRTGIRERRIAADGEFTSHMAAAAALKALENAGLAVEELDLIIVATVTPDTLVPGTACRVQNLIGASNANAFDISAACSGFLYAMEVARQFIAGHSCRNALVIGADKLSSLINWSDRNTCVLFGDGAGAVILNSREDHAGILSTFMGSNGDQAEILKVPGGGCALPITAENAGQNLRTLQMNGRETYRHAVTAMIRCSLKALDEAGLTSSDLACVIPHQANLRIIEAIADRLDLPMGKFYINLDRFGNTSAAAVAIALDEANRVGRIKAGDRILLVAFGGGLTYAASVVEW
ncbi:MAG: beta-ketoacyl-ACP synthase III [Terrimicrobiaceae bacterium]